MSEYSLERMSPSRNNILGFRYLHSVVARGILASTREDIGTLLTIIQIRHLAGAWTEAAQNEKNQYNPRSSKQELRNCWCFVRSLSFLLICVMCIPRLRSMTKSWRCGVSGKLFCTCSFDAHKRICTCQASLKTFRSIGTYGRICVCVSCMYIRSVIPIIACQLVNLQKIFQASNEVRMIGTSALYQPLTQRFS